MAKNWKDKLAAAKEGETAAQRAAEEPRCQPASAHEEDQDADTDISSTSSSSDGSDSESGDERSKAAN